MNFLLNDFYSEVSDSFHGQSFSLKVKRVLEQRRTKYQDLLIFESTNHGRVLVLDGMIQLTERDEFMYQEMIAMLPLNSHPNPENVLIIGGGDGAVAREVAKHPSVKQIVQCEIDEAVVELSKKYLPFAAVGFQSEKVSVVIGDGFEFLKTHKRQFDVIITDSTDPQGPGEVLFGYDYFRLVHESLKEDGLMCSQGQNIWLELDIIKRVLVSCKSLFPVVRYANGFIPTYTNGQIGYILCSNNPQTVFKQPVYKKLTFQDQLKYYSPAVHEAAFVLPRCIQQQVDAVIGS